MQLDYFEIRACVDFGDHTRSYLGSTQTNDYDDDVFTTEGALTTAQCVAFNEGIDPRCVFWTLYMRTTNGETVAVGDFKSFEDAYQVQCAILAPMRKAVSLLEQGYEMEAPSLLEDICNQSSNEDRL